MFFSRTRSIFLPKNFLTSQVILVPKTKKIDDQSLKKPLGQGLYLLLVDK